MGFRRVFTAASVAAVALLAQGAGALAAVPPLADMAITIAGPATAAAGTNFTYTITIQNNGPDTAMSLSFTQGALPPHTTQVTPFHQISGPPLTPNVPPGTVWVFSWGLQVIPGTPAGTVITKTMTVSAATTDPNPANNTSTVNTIVTGAAQADLAVTKTADLTAIAGDRFSSQVRVVNNGPQAAATVVVVDNLPAGLTGVTFTFSGTSVGSSDGCTLDLAGHITCHIAAMQLGQTFILDVSGTAAVAGDYTDTATASSATPDPNPANNAASATTHVLPRPSDGDGQVGDDTGENGNVDHGNQGAGGEIGAIAREIGATPQLLGTETSVSAAGSVAAHGLDDGSRGGALVDSHQMGAAQSDQAAAH